MIIRNKFVFQKCTEPCRVRIFVVDNSTFANRFVKVTISNKVTNIQLLKSSVKSWQWPFDLYHLNKII